MPVNEIERLRSVRRFDQYNFDLNKGLEDILSLATQVCETPVAFITLMDEDTQSFKVCRGLKVTQMPRSTSFCTHTIAGNGVLVVEDPLADDRFANIPLVAQEPHIRFYAGAPLAAEDGHNVGTLCVLDARPKQLPQEKRIMLEALARQAMHLMELELCLGLIRQKNDQITRQNNALLDIAFTQSHEFRGPLSTVMGFMNLIRDDDYNSPKEYLLMMEEAINKLDEKILLVVKSTEVAKALYEE